MNTYDDDTCDDDSCDETNFTHMMEQMNLLYPDAPFCYNCEDYSRLDEVLLDYPYALIYQNRTCYCVCGKDPTPITLMINSYNGKNITYRNFYKEIEKKWDKNYWDCNHNFLEFISTTNNIIELGFGS